MTHHGHITRPNTSPAASAGILARQSTLVTRGLDALRQLARGRATDRLVTPGNILIAANAGRFRQVEAILSLFPEAAHVRDARAAETPLHLAVQRGHVKVAEILLARGVPLEATTRTGATALHHAARGGHLSVLRLLLSRGASVTVQDKRRHTPLHWAARWGQTEALEHLLGLAATPIAATDLGLAMYLAARWGHVDAVALLLRCGAMPSAATHLGTALGFAARWGHVDTVALLLSLHAPADAKPSSGDTPLHWAAQWGHLAIATMLLDHGADVNAMNARGTTPLDSARTDDMRRLLVVRGGHHVRRASTNGSHIGDIH